MTLLAGKFQSHPTAAELLSYSRGEASENDDLEIQEHLVRCGACTRIVLDLVGETEADDPWLAAVWESLRGRLPRAPDEPAPVVTAGPRGGRRSPRFLAAAAALLVVSGLVAGSFFGGGDPDVPQSVASVDLVPGGYQRDGARPVPLVRAAEGSRFLVFRLLTIKADPAERLSAVIREEDGTVAARLIGLAPNENSRLEFLVPRRRLHPGGYTIALFRPGEEGAEALHRYRFAIDEGSR